MADTKQHVPARVRLGHDGPEMLPLGVGAWQWGDTRLWGFGRDFGAADVQQAFDAALAAGLSLFDTAEIYGGGASERLLGGCIRARGVPVLVATKFMPYPWRYPPGSLLRALEGSLGRLRLPAVDLYQVHWPVPLFPPERWARELADALEAGMTRAVGVSNYSADQVRRTHAALQRRGHALASNQVEYSLLNRAPEQNGVLAACRELGVTLIAYSPLAKGLLGGRYSAANRPPGVRRLWARRVDFARLDTLVGLLREIGQAHGGRTPAQVALNWTIKQGAVPIPGAKNARQVQDNAGALGWLMTDDEATALAEAADAVTRRR